LANLKQTGTVAEYHEVFIKLAHMVDFEKNLISLFQSGQRASPGEGEDRQTLDNGSYI